MTGTSLSSAITDGDYITFTITANEAGTLDLTGFSIDKAIKTAFIDRVADEWNVLAKVNGDSSALDQCRCIDGDRLDYHNRRGIFSL
jgi:hypothetical protein